MISNVSRWVVKGANGKWQPKPDLLYRQATWLTQQQNAGVLPYSLPASTAQGTPFIFRQPNYETRFNTPIVANYILFADSTDIAPNWTVYLRDRSTGRDLCNAPQHILNVGGTVNVWPYIHGTEFFPTPMNSARAKMLEERRKVCSPFFYTLTTPPVLASGTATTEGTSQSFNINIGEGHFECMAITAVATGDFTMDLTEVRTRRTLMNGRISQSNGMGTAAYPFIFSRPYFIPQAEQLRINMSDLSGTTNTVYLCLHGRRWFAPIADIPRLEAATAKAFEDEDLRR